MRLTVQNGAVVQQSSGDAVYLTPLALNMRICWLRMEAIHWSGSSEMSKQADVL